MSTQPIRPSEQLRLLQENDRLRQERSANHRALESKDRELAQRESEISSLKIALHEVERCIPNRTDRMLVRRLGEQTALLAIEQENRQRAETELARARARILELEAQLKETM